MLFILQPIFMSISIQFPIFLCFISKSFLNADVRWLIKRLKDFFCLVIECWCSFKYIQGCSQQNGIRIMMLYLTLSNMIVLVIYSARLLRCFDILWNDWRFWQLLSYSFPFKRKFHLAITLFYHVVKFKLYMYAIITFLDLGKKYII